MTRLNEINSIISHLQELCSLSNKTLSDTLNSLYAFKKIKSNPVAMSNEQFVQSLLDWYDERNFSTYNNLDCWKALKKLWSNYSDLRFLQLIDNVYSNDSYFVNDNVLLIRLIGELSKYYGKNFECSAD